MSQEKENQRRILQALNEAVRKLEAMEQAKHEPVAIVGVSGRFPGAPTLEAFWQLLIDGREGVADVPPERWDIDAYYDPDPDTPGKMNMRRAGFLTDIDQFDAAFFGIAAREVKSLDPQQRLLLEVSWEALERAGQTRPMLDESQTGVFIGITANDYGQLLLGHTPEMPLDTYFGSGNSLNAAAGRISYILGLQGPSMIVDTACSSSLVSVHLACQSLRAGECDMALAGGVNIILSPKVTAAVSRAKMLAPDGR